MPRILRHMRHTRSSNLFTIGVFLHRFLRRHGCNNGIRHRGRTLPAAPKHHGRLRTSATGFCPHPIGKLFLGVVIEFAQVNEMVVVAIGSALQRFADEIGKRRSARLAHSERIFEIGMRQHDPQALVFRLLNERANLLRCAVVENAKTRRMDRPTAIEHEQLRLSRRFLDARNQFCKRISARLRKSIGSQLPQSKLISPPWETNCPPIHATTTSLLRMSCCSN